MAWEDSTWVPRMWLTADLRWDGLMRSKRSQLGGGGALRHPRADRGPSVWDRDILEISIDIESMDNAIYHMIRLTSTQTRVRSEPKLKVVHL